MVACVTAGSAKLRAARLISGTQSEPALLMTNHYMLWYRARHTEFFGIGDPWFLSSPGHWGSSDPLVPPPLNQGAFYFWPLSNSFSREFKFEVQL